MFVLNLLILAEETETYNVYVTTSDKKGAGTDANVYIIICGVDGDTGKWIVKHKMGFMYFW